MVQSEAEVTELLSYLKNIQSYEATHTRSETATIGIVWGLLILFAGFMELYISLSVGYSPHGLLWFGILALAYLIQNVIASQPLLFEKTDASISTFSRANASRGEIMITYILILGSIPLGSLGFPAFYLVMPYIGFVFGLFHVIDYFRDRKKNQLSLRMAIGFLTPGVIIFVLIFLVDTSLFVYSGFIFGLFVGSTILYSGYQSRNLVIQDIQDLA